MGRVSCGSFRSSGGRSLRLDLAEFPPAVALGSADSLSGFRGEPPPLAGLGTRRREDESIVGWQGGHIALTRLTTEKLIQFSLLAGNTVRQFRRTPQHVTRERQGRRVNEQCVFHTVHVFSFLVCGGFRRRVVCVLFDGPVFAFTSIHPRSAQYRLERGPILTGSPASQGRGNLVALQFVVDAEGNVGEPKVEKSLGYGLDEKAIEAVKTWKFKPATRNGVPTPVRVRAEVNFQLY